MERYDLQRRQVNEGLFHHLDLCGALIGQGGCGEERSVEIGRLQYLRVHHHQASCQLRRSRKDVRGSAAN